MAIPRSPFGRTGHQSSRIIFGAAALGAMKPERALSTLEEMLAAGVNHVDTAAKYGDSELRLAPWLAEHRDEVFLASKTGNRSYDGAKASIHRSLERLEVEQLDLIQLHNLVDESHWAKAMGPGGALEALIEARDEGLVRFLGVTGHGTRVAERHLQSLERFDFDSVLVPYSYTMMTIPEYVADFERLLEVCEERSVGVQTIKSIARRRWQEDGRHFSWYEPIRDPEAIARAVHWVLDRPGLFLNTTSDARLLPAIYAAASAPAETPSAELVARDVEHFGMESLFVRDQIEDVLV
ncbi:MAG: aldo/keto reductase [Acidobacteriota bacterium]